MNRPSLNLIVLRSASLDLALRFYGALGLEFTQEQHGKGPVHHSCLLGGMVLELYPGKPGAAPERSRGGATLLGFQVNDLDTLLDALVSLGAAVLTPHRNTEWGRRAVVQDPDGRAVEFTEPAQSEEQP